MEAKYIACLAAMQDVVQLRSFLQHLQIFKIALESMTIFYDNTVTLTVANNPKYHGNTKHIKKKYHYIKDAII